MNNEIYSKLIVPARFAADGETPTKIVVTRENNGYAMFEESADETLFIKWFRCRNEALEYSVPYAVHCREMWKAKIKREAEDAKSKEQN